MKQLFRIGVCILTLLIPVRSPGGGSVLLAVQLKDGTRIIGSTALTDMPVRTSYAELKLPFVLISTIVVADSQGTLTVHFRNGDVVHGSTALQDLRIETMVGSVSAALATIVSISVLGGGSGPDDGLVAHFAFDGNTEEMTGHRGQAKAYHAVPTDDRFNNPTGAYLFNGIDSYVDLGSDTLLDPGTSLSITAWIRVDGGSKTRDIVTRWETRQHADDERTYALGVTEDGHVYWAVSPDGSHAHLVAVNTVEPLEPSTWTFIVAVWNGSTISLYQNGARAASAALARIEKSVHVRTAVGANIGREGDPTINSFSGAIDDVRLYSRALSDAEVRSLFEGK